MTDNEIDKAIDNKIDKAIDNKIDKIIEYYKNTNDPITRKKEEIDRLKTELNRKTEHIQQEIINRQKAEIDDLKQDTIPKLERALKRANEIGISLERENQELKAEIERLKRPLKKLSEIGYCHNFQLERSDLVSWIYAVCDVIKVVKEMEGKNDAKGTI